MQSRPETRPPPRTPTAGKGDIYIYYLCVIVIIVVVIISIVIIIVVIIIVVVSARALSVLSLYICRTY